MRLTENQWQYCINTVKEMAIDNPEKHERILFILSALSYIPRTNNQLFRIIRS